MSRLGGLSVSDFRRWGLGLLVVLLSACASAPSATGTEGDAAVSSVDPWETWNRQVFSFNEAIDNAALKPAAEAYSSVVPQPVREGFSNFVGNLSDVWSMVNNLLQLKPGAATQDFFRIGANTMFGVLGLMDVATPLGIDKQSEDFGQTLGRWGVGAGPYVMLPFFGPSTLRDTVAFPVDMLAAPSANVFESAAGQITMATLSVLNTRAKYLGASRLLDDIALDKYVFMRDAYLQRRRSQVRDGAPDDEPLE